MITLEKNIIEELITLLANIPCGQNAKSMPVGLVYAYLVMRYNEAEINGQHSDTAG